MYYFASDQHLGLGAVGDSRGRERLFVRWLDEVAGDATEIFLVGDLFDLWYEYRRVVPKGYSRVLGKLAELTDRGVKVHVFRGNHDLWSFGYLEKECGVRLHCGPYVTELGGKRVYITHGDDIGRRSGGVRFLNWMFRNRTLQWLFSHLIHPDLAITLGQLWSTGSRKSKSLTHEFLGEGEPLVGFAREYAEADSDVNYFVFGHTHAVQNYDLGGGRRALFLGEWIERPTYAVMRDGCMELKSYK